MSLNKKANKENVVLDKIEENIKLEACKELYKEEKENEGIKIKEFENKFKNVLWVKKEEEIFSIATEIIDSMQKELNEKYTNKPFLHKKIEALEKRKKIFEERLGNTTETEDYRLHKEYIKQQKELVSKIEKKLEDLGSVPETDPQGNIVFKQKGGDES